jgi:hypothetical protein
LESTHTALAAAVKRASSLAPPALAAELISRLGLTLTAAIGGAKDTRSARDWAGGERKPQRIQALRCALQATLAIASMHDDESAQAWFTSTNPDLDWRSPLAFIRDANEIDEYDRFVLIAVQDVS